MFRKVWFINAIHFNFGVIYYYIVYVYVCMCLLYRQMDEWFLTNGSHIWIWHFMLPHIKSVYNFQYKHVRSTFGDVLWPTNNNNRNFPIPTRVSTSDPIHISLSKWHSLEHSSRPRFYWNLSSFSCWKLYYRNG